MKKSVDGFRLSLVALLGLVLAAVASGQVFTEFTIPTSGSLPVGNHLGPGRRVLVHRTEDQ